MTDYGLKTEYEMLRKTTPQQKEAMLEAGVGGERLNEFQRKRTNEEDRLRAQMARAYQFMDSPLAPHGTSPQALGYNALANVLRSVGGLYLANKGEGQLADAQSASAAEHEALMQKLKMGRGAAKDVQQQGLSGALRNYGSYDGSI